MVFTCNIPARPTIEQDDDVVRITRWDFEPVTTGIGFRGRTS
jgi:hypothetical protein